ncbi:MAG: hypothetical protein K0Q93_2278 [Nocardioidaceae bacterium]|jgi:exodeoxyribonuclease V alpha subunit|nr:hypothetical protein [Nocardioidaceae bacterium]
MTAHPEAPPPRSRTEDTAVDVVARLVERAALDGSTCLPAPVLAAALRGVGVDSPGPVAERATDTGRVVAHLEERLFGHPHWSPLEEEVAQHLVELVSRSGPGAVGVVDAPRGSVVPGDSEKAVVVTDAHRLSLTEALELLARLVADDHPQQLVLVGDPAMPYAPGPGRVLADVVASGAVRVDRAQPRGTDGGDEQAGDQLAALVQSLRAGVLPAVDPSRHEVVVSPAADPEGAVRRAVQIVTTSAPRAFGLDPADLLVMSPRAGGRAGADALRVALDAAGAAGVRTTTTADAGTDGAEAIVLVLPAESAGSLTRSMLVGAATQAGRHLSVVHQAGPALAEAVARRPHPPRRTRLTSLLADLLA